MCVFSQSTNERRTFTIALCVYITCVCHRTGGRIIGETDDDGDAADDLDPEPQLVVIEPLPRIAPYSCCNVFSRFARAPDPLELDAVLHLLLYGANASGSRNSGTSTRSFSPISILGASRINRNSSACLRIDFSGCTLSKYA